MRIRIAAFLLGIAATCLGGAAQAQVYPSYEDAFAARARQQLDTIYRGQARNSYLMPRYTPGWTPELHNYQRYLERKQRPDIYGNSYFDRQPLPEVIRNDHIINSMRNPYWGK